MKKLIVAVIPFLLFIQPAFAADVLIQNDQPYIDDDGTLHIVGEIENNTNVPLNQIMITAKLLDDDGFQIGQVSGKSSTNVLMPGMNGAFDIIITGYDLHAITNYDLEFDYKITDPKNQAIEIISSELKQDSQGNLVISGMLENQGEITANMINVIATLYDRDGNVVTLSNVRIQPDFLRSGDSTFFIVPIHEKSQSVFVVDYTLIAESDEYAVVPEFPLGSGALLIASVSSYIILSRNPEKVINSISKISHFKR
jgi:type 1 fimbria pilin